MAKNFRIGQNSLQVSQTIVRNHPEIVQLKLVSHKVEDNWRQTNKTSSLKMKNILSGFNHDKPIKEFYCDREKFLGLNLIKLPKLAENEVWSLTSKVLCDGNTYKYIPMMNFHLDDINLGVVRETLKYICWRKNGCLLESGRFYHYYGNFLLSQDEWTRFIAEFLMPCIVVSPRYIGHRIYDGYCTLRLTIEKSYKPKLPEVIEVLNRHK